MSGSNNNLSPLRQRMIEDMTMRKLRPKTQTSYLRHVSEFGEYLSFSPHRASSEDLRLYQLHWVGKGPSSESINARLTVLRFFFEVTISDVSALKQTKHIKEPRRIPSILSVEEVTHQLDSVTNLKYQGALSISYGAGLRRNEPVEAPTDTTAYLPEI